MNFVKRNNRSIFCFCFGLGHDHVHGEPAWICSSEFQ